MNTLDEHSELETKLQALRAEAHDLDSRTDRTFRNMQKIIDESDRVANVARDAPQILDDLDREFEEKTQLDGVDITFLFLATAIQCSRQYILKQITSLISNDKSNISAIERLYGEKDWRDILVSPVPYDAYLGADNEHYKLKALGNSSVMGWIFGPVNILTSTITAYNMPRTMSVELPFKGNVELGGLIPQSRAVRNLVIMESVPTTGIFSSAISRAQSDAMNLPAAVLRHASRQGVSYFAQQGLPSPFMDTMKFMSANHGNLYQKFMETFGTSMNMIIKSGAMSAFVNAIISSAHSLFYNPEKYDSPKVYAVKTEKIIQWSNIIATSSNVIATAMSRDLTRLDIGGLLVTLNRIVCNMNFKHEIKREFITERFNEMIRGEEYDFE